MAAPLAPVACLRMCDFVKMRSTTFHTPVKVPPMITKTTLRLVSALLLCCCLSGMVVPAYARSNDGGLLVESLDGPVTDNEIQSFVAVAQTLQPAATGNGSEWAQGHSGENLKALALVYEIAPRKEILDTMVSFCDTLLSQRNDLLPAPAGQRIVWTGRIDPVWPNRPDAAPIETGGEQGDPVGHLANCAKQILRTPALHHQTVSNGDPFHFGATYLQRAKTYIAQADKTVDEHILRSLLNLSANQHMSFAANSPYQTGKPVPWNQQMMFSYAFANLAEAHQLLKDDPARVKRYDQIVRANVDWFFNNGLTSYTDKEGRPAYDWAYALPNRAGEDSNHGSLDVAGLYRLYQSGRYGISAAQMAPIANSVFDVMRLGDHHYAGRLNGSTGTGHGSDTNYLRSGYLFTALFRDDAYATMMNDSGIQAGSRTNRIDAYSRFLWVKHQRAVSK